MQNNNNNSKKNTLEWLILYKCTFIQYSSAVNMEGFQAAS